MSTVKPLDGVSALALILIASFAIDRVVSAVMFLAAWAGWVPDPAVDERKYKLIYYLLGAALAIFVIARYAEVRLMEAMGIKVDAIADIAITAIVLVGGADRIAGVLKPPGVPAPPAKPEPQPMMISGKLVLEDNPAAQKVLGHTQG